jgi:hypothetical protein
LNVMHSLSCLTHFFIIYSFQIYSFVNRLFLLNFYNLFFLFVINIILLYLVSVFIELYYNN